ncbi:MAG TPA: 1-deoxy-D-xylulose-5-phosphate synthase [Firmicutes bacterium]|nr:1-deoxy-D-xylulose-5-phosphate synthase [Bacillota bacterium]
MSVLNKIKGPDDIKKLTLEEMEKLAKEVRGYILKNVANTGGHLASNLGIVELTIALLANYDFAKDKIVFDVGHQSYVYKILTDRKDKFNTLRTHNGISGFPKREESIYDYFDTGHSSNSISACLGMARARDLKNEDYNIISVIGDGAFTGGMVYEALNDLGYKQSKMLIILNDNQMSISENVGSMSNYLNKIRLTSSYNKFKQRMIKRQGNIIIKIGKKIKNSFKSLVFKPMFFESLGIRYIGPIDGHNLKDLNEVLEMIKELDEPIVLHILTNKGQGYLPALIHPDKYHAVSKFDIETGNSLNSSSRNYSSAFGEALTNIARLDDKIVAITAAMVDGTGLGKFKEEFPNRLFDVGIAEGHAVTLAAGMATNGLKPVFAVYSTFLQRGFDQVLIDVCMQNLPVVFAIDRAGLVGNDGKTHQGVFDLSYLNLIPNIEIIAPKCLDDVKIMLEYAISSNKPIAIRYPRGGDKYELEPLKEIKCGRWEEVSSGDQVVVLATGKMVQSAMMAKDKLKGKCNPIVVNALFVKPLDQDYLNKIIKSDYKVLTLEDNTIIGGFGSQVLNKLNELGYKNRVKIMGIPDKFIDHGSVDELYLDEHIDIDSIAKEILNLYK